MKNKAIKLIIVLVSLFNLYFYFEKRPEYYINLFSISDEILPLCSYSHLLILYLNTEVEYVKDGISYKYSGSISDSHKNAIIRAYNNLSFLISDGSAGMEFSLLDVKIVEKPLTKITNLSGNLYYLSPEDIKDDLMLYAPPGKYDSVHVVWNNGPIESYWGLGGMFINGGKTTFDSIISGQEWWWATALSPHFFNSLSCQDIEKQLIVRSTKYYGQIFLHEWLHGACRFYEKLGFKMPIGDADGGGSHGYSYDPELGWMNYYRDLMQGKVWEPAYSEYTGITKEAWKRGTPNQTPFKIISPNGGEQWEEGQVYNIRWVFLNPVGNIKIDLIKNDVFDLNITTVPIETKSFSWHIPIGIADRNDYSHYKIRISSDTYNDASDKDFSIIPVSTDLYFRLTINCTDGGTTIPSPGSYFYKKGTNITVTAIPEPDYNFVNWTGDVSSELNPIIICVDRNITITANMIKIYPTPPAPTLLSPSNGATGVSTNPTLTWSASTGAASYRLQVSTSNTFSTTVFDQSGLTSTSQTVTNLSWGTTYYWRVNATNAAGTSDWSSVWSFTTTSVAPPAINLSRKFLYFGELKGSQTTRSQTFMITNSGGGVLDWAVTDNAAWLTCSPSSGTGNAAITVTVSPSGLNEGTYTATITVSSSTASNSPQTVTVTLNVYNAGASATPFGFFDTPTDGASGIEGAIAVTGWALDDIELTKVEIKRDPHPLDNPVVIGPDGLVYIGDGVFVEGARPDVEQVYPTYPLAYRAGWGYMLLTNFLPNQGNGSYRLHAIAYDKEGNRVTLGVKTIHCDNAHATYPFGTIDTPSQGGQASGASYVNFAWALTPQPKYIPTDGSTILVWIDGVPQSGHPSYNHYRSDIATLFPGYANSNGAVGYYYLDTTKLANGVHTIAWSVVDSAGVAAGIGSRYFTVLNTGAGALGGFGQVYSGQINLSETPSKIFNFIGGKVLGAISEIEGISLDISPIYMRRGYDPGAIPKLVFADSEGWFRIKMNQAERIEVILDSEAKERLLKDGLSLRISSNLRSSAVSTSSGKDFAISSNEGSGQWHGYLAVGEELRSLPTGSYLDSVQGIFFWQPGPAFFGDYSFIFIKIGPENTAKMKKIKISISSK